MPSQQGHYGPEDLQWIIEHDGTVLAELDNGGVSWDFDPSIEPAGAGLGLLKNTYYKTVGAPKGTFKVSRAHLTRNDKGALFLDLVQGGKYVIQEAITAASTTYTVGLANAMISILEIRLTTTNAVLREFIDYTVSYVTGTITFAVSTPETAIIRYLSSTRKATNLLINGGFEDLLTGIWTPVGTATIARNTANAYVEGNALAVTPAATNDGVQYGLAIPLQPGRTYRHRGRAKAAAAETLVVKWNDGTTDLSMTVVSGATLTTSFTTFEFTFVATKAQAANIKILDSKVSPALFYLDELALFDDTAGSSPSLGVNPMDAGLGVPFTFNLIGRRVGDGVVVHRFQRCAIDKLGFKSGNVYKEDVSGMFLDYIPE